MLLGGCSTHDNVEGVISAGLGLDCNYMSLSVNEEFSKEATLFIYSYKINLDFFLPVFLIA